MYAVQELKDVFKTVGRVTRSIIKTNAAGESTGKAVVEFANRKDAETAAKDFHLAAINKQTITVRVARS
jgi:RNA recognition motif-containing protein